MGGSSLAPEVLWRTFGAPGDALDLHVLDSTDPAAIRAVEEAIDLEQTLFIVSTKSGGTIETLSLFEHFHALVPDGGHFVAITDPGSSCSSWRATHGFRAAFENDPNIGGRYSALSLFGLVPAALIGAPVHALLERAAAAEQACAHFDSTESNPGLWLGLALGELARHGRDKLTFVVGDPVASFGLWVEQLVAESTGKQGRGILPVADEPLLAPDAYGADRVFVHLRDPALADADTDARDRRARRGRPPDDHARRRRRRGPRPDVLHRRVRDRGRGLGARDQPVRPAQRRRRRRTPPSACSPPGRCRSCRSPATTRCGRCSTGGDAGGYIALMGYVRRRSSSTRRSPSCARR